VLHARNSAEVIPARQPFGTFPRTLNGWSSIDIAIDKDVLDILGPGDFLLRNYRDRNSSHEVSLFVAYFPSQRSGDTIHSPKHCLPGAGWIPIRNDRIQVNVPGSAPFSANRYLIAKGEDRQLVLYWYFAHNRAIASEYSAKFYLIKDSIRMHRSDGALIRVITPMSSGERIEPAQQRLISFIDQIVGLLSSYVPR
jgi:EpsI family protein